MAWFFSARCPVDEEMRKWVEYRMAWLTGEFGLETWWSAPAVTPTDEFFPDRFDGSEHAVEIMLQRVCQYMGINPDKVTLRLYDEGRHAELRQGLAIHSEGGGSAGRYTHDEKHIVMIEASGLSDTAGLVATIAHELSHVRLLGEGRVTGDEDDHEQLTDLATVFFGLGVFNANSVVNFNQWSKEGWSGWSSSKKGYLNEATFAYALALWAYVRREDHWLRHLRPTVRSMVKQGIRYVEKNPPKGLAERRRPIGEKYPGSK